MNKNWLELALDLVWPRQCSLCGQEGSFLCPPCQAELVLTLQPNCFYCQQMTAHFELCQRCRSRSNLTGILTACYYDDRSKRLLAQFKYQDYAALVGDLGSLMAANLSRFPALLGRIDSLTPIPLYLWRRLYRGYNQAELLTQFLGKALGKPLTYGLIRRRGGRPQVELPRRERLLSPQGAFTWQGAAIRRKSLLLVDDVATTGATLEAAAEALRRGGAREVWGITFAKG